MDTAAKEVVANKWSKHASGDVSYLADIMWNGNALVQKRTLDKQTRGSGDFWATYCMKKYTATQFPDAVMASFGCGTGDLERHLSRVGWMSRCDGFDISPKSIDAARQNAENLGMTDINYILGDLETSKLTENEYDAAWFNASLHHIQELDAVLKNVAGSIKPNGYLFLNEYIGPNHFDFPDRQKALIRAAFEILPQRFRRSFIPAYPHEFLLQAQVPNPENIVKADPSEAIRSEDIMSSLEDHFEIIERNDYGGTILQYAINGIAGNFQESDEDSKKALELLFTIEDTLIELGDIESTFTMVVARPKK